MFVIYINKACMFICHLCKQHRPQKGEEFHNSYLKVYVPCDLYLSRLAM